MEGMEQEAGGVRLVTFNLWHDALSWPRRAPVTARQMAALAPDIAAVQEVGIPDQQTSVLAEVLGRATDRRYTVAACEQRRPDGWVEGLAVVTHHAVEASDTIEVDGWGTICLWTRLRTPDRRALDLYNLHLNPHQSALRHRQISAVLDHAAGRQGSDARILCGDFNAAPDGGTVERVRRAGFASAHALHHGAEPERTFPTPLRAEVHARRPATCLDYIFLDPAALSVASCHLALNEPDPADPALYPSDHAGLVAEMIWIQ
jgi:endonuclease/exonuclease/phosphatase family metal-dependent hydrolase